MFRQLSDAKHHQSKQNRITVRIYSITDASCRLVMWYDVSFQDILWYQPNLAFALSFTISVFLYSEVGIVQFDVVVFFVERKSRYHAPHIFRLLYDRAFLDVLAPTLEGPYTKPKHRRTLVVLFANCTCV